MEKTSNSPFDTQAFPRKKGYSPHKTKEWGWIGNHILQNVLVRSDRPSKRIPAGGRYGWPCQPYQSASHIQRQSAPLNIVIPFPYYRHLQ